MPIRQSFYTSLAGDPANNTYTHWPNGSLRTDSSQNLQICCNFRNLPCAFIVGSMTAPSAEVRGDQSGPGHDGLRSKILRPDPRTMDDSGPAGRQVLQRLAVCVLQQQSGELCGSGWKGSMA